MPEGDSYVRAAARIGPVLTGQVITRAEGVPQVRRNLSRIVGATATSVATQGKHLLIHLSTDWTLHVWLGMPGRVRVTSGTSAASIGQRHRDESVDRGAVRLLLETALGRVEVWSAPTVEVERSRVIADRLATLGPDVLADEFDWPRFERALAAVDPNRLVGDVLLDQRVLAGIGNEYRNEILFLEGVHPLTRLAELEPDRAGDLVRRAIRLMAANVGRGRRVTTGARMQPTWVYGRTGAPCRRCRCPIRQDKLGTPPRITYWCPRCQVPGDPAN